MSIKKFLSILFVSVICLNLKSQTNFLPGYIITNDNDTIKGLIDYRGDMRNSRTCSFKYNENSRSISYEPFEIKAFRFINSKYYLSKIVPTKNNQELKLFIEFLVDGISDLYYYRDDSGGHFLISKNEGTLAELTNEEKESYIDGVKYIKNSNAYIGTLKLTYSDCFAIQKEIDKADFTPKTFISITKHYHELVCKDQQCIVYEKRFPPIKVQFSPFAGLYLSDLSYKNEEFYSNVNFEANYYPVLGLKMTASLPSLNDKISIQITSSINKQYYFGFSEKSTFFQNEYNNIRIHLTNLNLIGSVKYTYPTGKIRPTISLGLGQSFILQNNSSRILETQYATTVKTFEYTNLLLPAQYTIFSADFGFDFDLNNSRILFVNAIYSNEQGKYISTRSVIQLFGINTGINF